jgi:hypothetical protein
VYVVGLFGLNAQQFAFADLPYGHCGAGAGVDGALAPQKKTRSQRMLKNGDESHLPSTRCVELFLS